MNKDHKEHHASDVKSQIKRSLFLSKLHKSKKVVFENSPLQKYNQKQKKLKKWRVFSYHPLVQIISLLANIIIIVFFMFYLICILILNIHYDDRRTYSENRVETNMITSSNLENNNSNLSNNDNSLTPDNSSQNNNDNLSSAENVPNVAPDSDPTITSEKEFSDPDNLEIKNL